MNMANIKEDRREWQLRVADWMNKEPEFIGLAKILQPAGYSFLLRPSGQDRWTLQMIEIGCHYPFPELPDMIRLKLPEMPKFGKYEYYGRAAWALASGKWCSCDYTPQRMIEINGDSENGKISVPPNESGPPVTLEENS